MYYEIPQPVEGCSSCQGTGGVYGCPIHSPNQYIREQQYVHWKNARVMVGSNTITIAPIPKNIREEIAEIIRGFGFHSALDYSEVVGDATISRLTDSILALVQPLVVSVPKNIREEIAMVLMGEIDEKPDDLTDADWQQCLTYSDKVLALVQPLIEQARQEGRREVVEWVETNQGHIDRWMKKEERVRHYCPNCDNSVIGVYPSEWQAKLKEWGIAI